MPQLRPAPILNSGGGPLPNPVGSRVINNPVSPIIGGGVAGGLNQVFLYDFS